MLYRPSPSVTTERTFSIRAGLAASTVTPGIASPDVSRTTPAMPLACCALAGALSARQPSATRPKANTLDHRSLECFTGPSNRKRSAHRVVRCRQKHGAGTGREVTQASQPGQRERPCNTFVLGWNVVICRRLTLVPGRYKKTHRRLLASGGLDRAGWSSSD